MEQVERYSTYLQNAIEATDNVFGEGYAKEHPELVSALVQAMVAEANAKMSAEALQEGLAGIANAMKQGGLVEGR